MDRKGIGWSAFILTMLPTQASGAGTFAQFDLNRVPSPCFVVDEIKLEENLKVLQLIRSKTDTKILLALKAFSMWAVGPLISKYLDGCCASGLWEARLARKYFAKKDEGKIVSTFSPAYHPHDIEEITDLSDHIIFNSPSQREKWGGDNLSISQGLRINPLNPEGLVGKYDPCRPGSRLGWPIDQVTESMIKDFDGLHLHTLCEQDFPPLDRTWSKVSSVLGKYSDQFSWINLGGGHHLTRTDYQVDELVEFLIQLRNETGAQILLEPGEAVALDAGILVGEVLDIMDTGVNHALLDLSATCHAPDVIEAPYRPSLLGDKEKGKYCYRLGGVSCLAGDVFGDYQLNEPLRIGQRIAFLDQAHYSMVKTNTFNGVPLPSIALWNSENDNLRIVKRFSFDDFEERLS